VVDVTIDRARSDDNTCVNLVLHEVVSQEHGVSKGMRSTDHNEASKTQSNAGCSCFLLLFSSAKFVTSTANKIDTTQVTVVLKVLHRQGLVVLVVKAFNAVHETNNLSIATCFLESQQAIDNVISASSLLTQVYETDPLFRVSVN